jgi:hypothetical protein
MRRLSVDAVVAAQLILRGYAERWFRSLLDMFNSKNRLFQFEKSLYVILSASEESRASGYGILSASEE